MKMKKHLNFKSLCHLLSEKFAQIEDWRQVSKVGISIHDALMLGFFCMYFQEPSWRQFRMHFQNDRHVNQLKKLCDIERFPGDTQLRMIIDNVPISVFSCLFKQLLHRLQRGKYLERYQLLSNYYYCPLDGTQIFSSTEIHCEQCLRQMHQEGVTTYSHQVLQAVIAHPEHKDVIPFMPEPIANSDGQTKQDCETNAAKRFLVKLRKDYPRLKFIIGGDDLYATQPCITLVQQLKMCYIFVAKPNAHKYMMNWLSTHGALHTLEYLDAQQLKYTYEWMNNIPLTGQADSVRVNFFRCTTSEMQGNQEVITYQSSWITDIPVSADNIEILVKTGRSRWKIENEGFNTLKNQGYSIERNYGHGKKNLSFNFYIMKILAFYFHQIFEITSRAYQYCRQLYGSKKNLWQTLRIYFRVLLFDTWEQFLTLVLKLETGQVGITITPGQPP